MGQWSFRSISLNYRWSFLGITLGFISMGVTVVKAAEFSLWQYPQNVQKDIMLVLSLFFRCAASIHCLHSVFTQSNTPCHDCLLNCPPIGTGAVAMFDPPPPDADTPLSTPMGSIVGPPVTVPLAVVALQKQAIAIEEENHDPNAEPVKRQLSIKELYLVLRSYFWCKHGHQALDKTLYHWKI